MGSPIPTDASGLRVKKVSGSTTTVYVFSGSKVIAEYDNGAAVGSPSREYIYGGSALLAKIDSSGTKYYHQDHLSSRVVTSSTGVILEQMGHFPFGETWYNATTDKLFFTTYERDAESGNDYAQARYYVNRLSRFSGLDQKAGDPGDPQTLNLYPYVRNDPIDSTDPTGQFRVAPCVTPAYANCGLGGGVGWSGSWEGELIDFAFTPTGVGWEGDPFLDNLGALGLLDPDSVGGRFFGGPMDVSGLVRKAMAALLNDDCASLFGGISNAIASIMNSSYDRYVLGQANPFPDQVNPASWSTIVGNFETGHSAVTHPYKQSVGGIIFFSGQLNFVGSDYATAPDQVTQMTVFFHEQEHAANHYRALDRAIDSNYPLDIQKINERCKPVQVEQESAPITGELTPQ